MVLCIWEECLISGNNDVHVNIFWKLVRRGLGEAKEDLRVDLIIE